MRPIAAVVCVALIAFLFRRELTKPDREVISWAPFVWMFIAGSRFVSRWLNLGASADFAGTYAEGSFLDRNLFLLLILWGAAVLSRRNIRWGQLLASNIWLVAYLLYCLSSMAWSEEPTILAKRWFKDLGNPIMALVLLTEKRPYEAMVVTLRRLAFVWLPVSILFIRYYPEFGRAYSPGGGVQYSGIADQKNTLGLSCLLVGVACAWRFLLHRRMVDRYDVFIAGMLAWLLFLSNSKTSLACLLIAIAVMFYASRPGVSKRPAALVVTTVLGAILYTVGDAMFGLRDYVLGALNRDPTLTNRTDIWDVLLSFKGNPMVGTGFMSFWTGSRMDAIWAIIGVPINQAHNGYLEQYLNLGYIGVAFIGAIALATLSKVWRHLRLDYPGGVLRFCLLIIALIYNYTEASFYGISNMWVLFLAASIDPPQLQSNSATVATLPRQRPLSAPNRRPARVAGAAARPDAGKRAGVGGLRARGLRATV